MHDRTLSSSVGIAKLGVACDAAQGNLERMGKTRESTKKAGPGNGKGMPKNPTENEERNATKDILSKDL